MPENKRAFALTLSMSERDNPIWRVGKTLSDKAGMRMKGKNYHAVLDAAEMELYRQIEKCAKKDKAAE